jgi:hypothetical protein
MPARHGVELAAEHSVLEIQRILTAIGLTPLLQRCY